MCFPRLRSRRGHSANHRRQPPRPRTLARPLELECLEGRTVPAVVWANRLAATDTFTAAERAVVDQAVAFWNRIVLDFDNDPNNAARTFNATITGGSTSGLNLGGGTVGQADNYAANAGGIPTSARIQIDADAGGNANGWYIDPNPSDNAEFTTLSSPFYARGGPAGRDMYSTLLHELGHSLGFAASYDNFSDHLTNDPMPFITRTYTGANGLTATLVSAGSGTHLSGVTHPNDLLNTGRPGGVRALPSDLDVRLLADAFGYRVALPSTVQTFLANLNTTTGVLTLNADPLATDNDYTLERRDGDLRVTVNRSTVSIPLNSVTSITVNTGANTDTLTVNDQTSPIGDWYGISGTTLSSLFFPQVNYGAVDQLVLNASGEDSIISVEIPSAGLRSTDTPVTINAGGGDDIITVESTSARTPVTINAGGGDDVIRVTSDSFGDLGSAVTVNGGLLGSDALEVYDQGTNDGRPQSYTIRSNSIVNFGATLVNYSGLESLLLRTSAWDDTITVESMAVGTSATVDARDGRDTVQGRNAANTWSITGNDTGTLNGSLTFTHVEGLAGGASRDEFRFGPSSGVSGNIDGGEGSDTLDYSALGKGGVQVDLSVGAAAGVSGSVLRIDDVIGSPGNDTITGNAGTNVLRGGSGNDVLYGGDGHDVLVGGDGDDMLGGGDGRDLLIGGLGIDVLLGGGDDDILIGGTTSYDTNRPALVRILDEWSRDNKTYEQRIDHLRNGAGLDGLNGNYVLTALTVTEDDAADQLTGGAGQDWFFFTPLRDTLADRQESERRN